MKKINFTKTISLFAATFAIGFIFSQVQMQKWYLKNHEIDFSTAIPTASPEAQFFGEYGVGGTTSSQDDFELGNAIHDANGNKLISVYKNQVFCANGLSFDLPSWNWEDAGDMDDYGADIIPKPGSPCEFFIVYSFTKSTTCVNCPPGYCGTSNHSTLLYIDVNLAANNGQGSYSTTATPLLPCQGAKGIVRAIGK